MNRLEDNMTEGHKEVLAEINEFLTDDTTYDQLLDLVDDGNFDSEEQHRDFARILGNSLGIEYEPTHEEAKWDHDTHQWESDREEGYC